MSLLDNARVTVETSLAPAITIGLGGALDGEQGLLTKFLRPRVTVWSGNTQLARLEPAGDPNSGPPWGLMIAGAALVLLWLKVR